MPTSELFPKSEVLLYAQLGVQSLNIVLPLTVRRHVTIVTSVLSFDDNITQTYID